LKEDAINAFLETVVDNAIGLAPSYGSGCVLSTIAFSSASQVLLIRLSTSKASRNARKGKKSNTAINRSLLEAILCHDGTKYGFKMDKLSAALHLDLGLHITDGVDLLSITKENRNSRAALMTALGGELTLNKAEVSMLFKDEEIGSDIYATAMRAWAACHVGQLQDLTKRLAIIARINTRVIKFEVSQMSFAFLSC
jgi:regulator of nonsense transcripts 1